MQYSWPEEEFITQYTKKSEYGNIIYLACSKRGVNGKDCNGKAKFDRKTGIVIIYEKCKNEKKIIINKEFLKFTKKMILKKLI